MLTSLILFFFLLNFLYFFYLFIFRSCNHLFIFSLSLWFLSILVRLISTCISFFPSIHSFLLICSFAFILYFFCFYFFKICFLSLCCSRFVALQVWGRIGVGTFLKHLHSLASGFIYIRIFIYFTFPNIYERLMCLFKNIVFISIIQLLHD